MREPLLDGSELRLRLDRIEGGDPVERSRELALLGGFNRLRDFDVPRGDLPEVAAAAAERGGNRANPRPASAEEILELLAGIW